MNPELKTVIAALAHVHELSRIIALNPQLDQISKTRSEELCRQLLALLYTRLAALEGPGESLPPNIMSDY